MVAPKALPFTPEASDATLNALRQRQKELQGFTRKKQALEEDYVVNRRNVEQRRPEVMRQILNNFAGRGMARSSGYGVTQGLAQSDIAAQIGNLLQNLTRGRMNIRAEEADSSENYQVLLEQIQRAAARQLSQRAGNLNLT